MSSPPHDPVRLDEDDPMKGSAEEEEGEGDATMNDGAAISDDSSEEPEEDEEEEKKIREGFIVDEDEEEDDDDDEEERRRRKRRKRKHRRHREEEEDLDDEDLELLDENTGGNLSKKRLTRLRRGGDSDSSPPRRRKPLVESSDDDLDNDDLELPQVQDIQRIWDDGGGQDDDEDLNDMDDFIEYEDEEGQGAMDEREREALRKERRRERRKAMLGSRELVGIDANAWDEIHEVFGDGHEYDWALVEDEEVEYDAETLKPDMKYQDVFEPSEIRDRLLTEDDDLIRAQDIPERMQLASSSLSQSSTLSLNRRLPANDLDEAAEWVVKHLSALKERDFFRPDGRHHHLLSDLIQAVTQTLKFLFMDLHEVPYIWTHRRDYISYFNPRDMRTRVSLLSLDELWRVQSLGQKYCSLLERRAAMESLYHRLEASDEYFEKEIRPRINSVEVVMDTTEWLSMKYKEKKKDNFELTFHDDDEKADAPKRKLPSRLSNYEVLKRSIVSKLAEGFGLMPHEVVLNFLKPHDRPHLVEDQELNPTAFAEQFADPDPSKALPAEKLLERARMILATELGKDPLLREEIRQVFVTSAQISVLPTERGISKIDEHHPYFNFKYLYQKPVGDMLQDPQFLHILAAETEHLVTVSVSLPGDVKADFERRLREAFESSGYSDSATAWNAERFRVVQDVVDKHLVPAGVKHVREWLREEIEDTLAAHCADVLRDRLDVAPYVTPTTQHDETPSVLAISWGKGVPHRDDITAVFLDEAGRLREHTRFASLDTENQSEFKDLVERRKPDVIVIGGFSMATARLSKTVKEVLRPDLDPDSTWSAPADRGPPIPVIYVFDEVARIYQHSKRAEGEFGSLSSIAKYCVGLARYTQSPLNEYAALGRDLTAISLDEQMQYQHLIPKEKLLTALEHALVDIVNKVGVDINRAVIDSYYQHLLPYVCGLGPRKAQVLVKKIAALGGNVVNREQFVKAGLLTRNVFVNAVAFLRITADTDSKPSKNRHNEDADVADPLDNTRIHPEDYDLARKMAIDALELDEEDIEGEHASHTVSLIMQDPDNVRKLDELNLDDFALSMFENNEDRKRYTLDLVKAELVKPFGEKRGPFQLPTAWDVLTMLSGETRRTLHIGFIVSVLVTRIKPTFVSVRLDSGVEGMINTNYLADQPGVVPDDVVKKGQTIPGVVIDIKMDLNHDSFFVELSSRPADVQGGDSQFRRVKHDDCWNHDQHARDTEMQARKKRAEIGRTRRIIKHPNFHNFNATQAELHLENQQRGDVVIRPSSKGTDHIAVTWKVDEHLFQHIDVVELNAEQTGGAGSRFVIENGKYEFSDLDELIVNHVQAMARRVEELMAHEKFKAGAEEELHLFLRNFVAANPSKSAYGFTLNRKRPGHFNLCFLANKISSVQTWPVRVAPEAYYLYETAAPGVAELCDAFKVRHAHESQNLGGAGTGGKTPYAARTPGRVPGHATPGHRSTRQVGRTPNPYSGATPAAPTPAWGTSAPPSAPPANGWGAPPPQSAFGYSTPSHFGGAPPPPPPSTVGPAMNPERARLIESGGGNAWAQTPSRW
ncbi:transcription elongation factor Spt6 [Punctularia strigosozonata HHB-11173 SS5]|uniref:transcription elongation factor Spt6 n=1 Tax=Punctularia strigosozonata (strain HHB-11173) TaxID=741275 RepID=UPI00044184C6|nr:transcription elongation factor Spt6 [Punctularia strigosozonata HHB-11173 SS5]EIN07299.1 transcription elongation factor Spt6 [Punctularia strigosozonata HHB-11173 SS5]